MDNRFKRLPKLIKIEDTIAQVDTRGVPDPERGHDTDRDFMIRYAVF